MSGIAGALNINDSDRVYVSTLGQNIVYDAIQQTLAQYNADLMGAMSVFVDSNTSNYKERYKLPGGGRLQRTTGNGGPTGAFKANGQWDVAYPLEGFGTSIASGRVDYAYMTVGDLDRHMSTVTAQNTNTVRFELLKALLNSGARTFVDPLWGSLSVQPLANGDSVVYPPVLGSESEATENHYLESGYAASAISDTNNPFKTIRDELEEHFGTPADGSEIVCFINDAQTAKSILLTEFNDITDRYVEPGSNTDTVRPWPAVPGRMLGRTDSGVWVAEWRWIPANYVVGVHLAAPKPLKMRVDPADTGLGTGLQLIATDQEYPLRASYWENRFGFGVANRLNGVVMELGTGGTYDIPTAYA